MPGLPPVACVQAIWYQSWSAEAVERVAEQILIQFLAKAVEALTRSLIERPMRPQRQMSLQ